MKTRDFFRMSFLLLAGWAAGVHAQTVWTYEVIGGDNRPRSISIKPPMDISYPRGNDPAPIADARDKQLWVPLTAREEADRLNAPKLIILLGSGNYY